MRSFTGIPYAEMDCLALLCAYMAEHYEGVPRFTADPKDLLLAMGYAKEHLDRVYDIEDAHIVGLGRTREIIHVGAVTPEGILHTTLKTGSIIQPLSAILRHPLWRHHRLYRWHA